ncbi:cytochrome P450 [Nocardioides pocheonensis]|uniref:Cytochrome P450 n=1 Tax=Nocardioides pocheonensis TaxID=661485 RepID=A0A3N0GH95_9ACTN|nr:cytochrome P450 [Nocardioides pocheonensis]RNM11801.1 cytochrome P450 [Nocardioides pocheonensis]
MPETFVPSVPPESMRPGEYLPWDDPDFLQDPYPWFARVQRDAPVFRDPSGMYVVTRYDDVFEFGKHPAMSVEPGWDQAGPWAIAGDTIIGRDQPDHTRLRRLTNRWFTPKVVRDWVTTTAAVTSEVLDGLAGDTVDGWHELSVIPTHRTMCRVLQLPDGDAEAVKKAMEQAMLMLRVHPRPGELELAETAFEFLLGRMESFLDAKRSAPGDGLADELLAASGRGELSPQEALATIAMFYGLGHMDVGYTIASGLCVFAQRPDVYQAFRNREDLREQIVNEVVRFDPPELSFYRTTTEDLTIRGVEIPAGSTIRFMIGAANRDPEVFQNPQVFDYNRPTGESRNLSFGLGLHSCAGQVISRAEALTVFEVVASRFRRIEPADEVIMENTDFSRHFKSLPLRLVP